MIYILVQRIYAKIYINLKQTAIVFKLCFFDFIYVGEYHIQNLKKSI